MERRGVRRIGNRVEVAYRDVEDFLASPAGRRVRRLMALGAIVGSKLLFRIPGLRRYPLIRVLDKVGGAALVARFAKGLRDWEPRRGDLPHEPMVIDVPAASPVPGASSVRTTPPVPPTPR